MGIYLYENPETSEIKEVFQGMNDLHEYQQDGIKWQRVWTVPAGVVDGRLNPWSAAKFVEKTGKGSDTYGSLLDRSAELSAKRAEECGGKDPLKERVFENYQKKCSKEHPLKIQERARNLEVEI